MAGKIDKISISKKIISSSRVIKNAEKILEQKVLISKNKLINQFIQHPVTQELQNGESSTNISGTLGGYGNLFSFIGFPKGFNPIDPILTLLNQIKLNRNPKISGNKLQFRLTVPSKNELSNVSKMPWETGRSWLFDVEKTISGLGAYLFIKTSASRSGQGIQMQKESFARTFRPVKYFNSIYNSFLKTFNKNK